MTAKPTEYRIRQAQYATRLFGPDKQAKDEWVVEEKRAPVEGEDDYAYQRDGWVRITSGATEREAKQFFIRWLSAEIEAVETGEDFS